MKGLPLAIILFTLMVTACKPSDNQGNEPGIDTTNTTLKVSTTAIELESIKGATAQIEITTNAPWIADASVLNTNSWLKIDPSSGSAGTYSISIETTFNNNKAESTRSGKIQISAGGITRTIDVTQKCDPEMQITNKLIECSSDGGVISISIYTNTDYTVTIPQECADWIRRDLLPTKNSYTQTEKFYITQNNSPYKPRQGMVIISKGEKRETISIIQSSLIWAVDVKNPGSLKGLISRNDLINRTTMTITGVMDMDDFVFLKEKARNLKNLDISGLNMEYMPDGAFEMFGSTLTEVILPDILKKVADRAFKESGVISVIIPQAVETIGRDAFNGCWKLTSVNIPPNVRSIEGGAFGGTGLSTVIIPNGVENIGINAFSACNELALLSINSTVKTIYDQAFSNCPKLSSVALPQGLTHFGEYVFQGCYSLQHVELPDDLTTIPDGTFEGCKELTYINIPPSVKTIGYHAFSTCYNLTNIDIPLGVTEIGGSAFESCIKLTTITIPENVTKLNSAMFRNCVSLTSVTLPNNPLVLSMRLFEGCESLTQVTIPNTIKQIDYYALHSCTSLTEITIPASVREIVQASFYNTPKLKNITVLAVVPPKFIEVDDNDKYSLMPFGPLLPGRQFRVPAQSLELYKTDPLWSYYASEIVAM